MLMPDERGGPMIDRKRIMLGARILAVDDRPSHLVEFHLNLFLY